MKDFAVSGSDRNLNGRKSLPFFNCVYCGKPIRLNEDYYCLALTKERITLKKPLKSKGLLKENDTEIVPAWGEQVSQWCKNCCPDIPKKKCKGKSK